MTRHPETQITGPAFWRAYLLDGNADSLHPDDKAKADAWLARERVQIVGLERDASGEPYPPYFSWAMRLHAPELDCDGAVALDYRALELSIDLEESL